MENRLYKTPLYKIGDIIVYKDRYIQDDGLACVYQSKIIRASGLVDLENPEDIVEWAYTTEEIDSNMSDNLYEKDIMYKLN